MDGDDNAAVIWAKTDAGRGEMLSRSLVKERAQRNLLLVIDGVKSDRMLLAGLTGISAGDFKALEALGLISPVDGPIAPPGSEAAPPNAGAPADALDPAEFAAVLTRVISRELGLRGFMLTLAVEKAATPPELLAVARRAVAQIRERRGEAAAAAASRLLLGA